MEEEKEEEGKDEDEEDVREGFVILCGCEVPLSSSLSSSNPVRQFILL